MLNGIIACLFETNFHIRKAAADTLRGILNPGAVQIWEDSALEGDSASPRDSNPDDVKSPVKNFWKISTNIVWLVGKNLIDVDFTMNNMGQSGIGASSSNQSMTYNVFAKQMLELITDLLNLRNEYLRKQVRSPCVIKSIPERYSCSVVLEILALVFLCYSDNQITSLVAKLIDEVFQEARLLGEVHDDHLWMKALKAKTPNDSQDGNLSSSNSVRSSSSSLMDLSSPKIGRESDIKRSAEVIQERTTAVYRQQSPSGILIQHSPITMMENMTVYNSVCLSLQGSGIMMTGQKAHQKKMRKILRGMEKATTGNTCAWEEIYKRWNQTSQVLTSKDPGKGNPLTDMDANVPGLSRARNLVVGKVPGLIKEASEAWESSSDLKSECQNFGGVLCSYGGCILEAARNLNVNVSTALPVSISSMLFSVFFKSLSHQYFF